MTTSAPFGLDAGYVDLAERARSLAASVADIASEADEADSVDRRMLAALAGSGLARLLVPSAHGGAADQLDPLAVTVVREQLAAESSHLDSLFAMQGIGSYALATGGSDTIRNRWLPRVAAVEAIAAFALTEPHVGSDLKALSTTVKEDGADLIISGHKSFITNAGDAAFYCVLGREDSAYSLVLVPADSTGLSTSRPHQVIAPHVLGDVVLDEVRVPKDHRIGPPGEGFSLVLDTLTSFRVSVAGAAIGTAQAALDEAVAHCCARTSFGGPLIQIGAVGQLLALSWTEIEMARSFVYQTAASAANDPRLSLTRSTMAKVAATEVAGRVVDRCVQTMGRFGLVRGSKIERLSRAARPMRVYEGATEVLLDSLARQLAKGNRG
jgi:acyl-CoA dehydrogenase